MPALMVSEIKSIPHKRDYEIKNVAHKEHVVPHCHLLMSPNKTNLRDNSAFLNK